MQKCHILLHYRVSYIISLILYKYFIFLTMILSPTSEMRNIVLLTVVEHDCNIIKYSFPCDYISRLRQDLPVEFLLVVQFLEVHSFYQKKSWKVDR